MGQPLQRRGVAPSRLVRVPEDCPARILELITACITLPPAQRPSAMDIVAALSVAQ